MPRSKNGSLRTPASTRRRIPRGRAQRRDVADILPLHLRGGGHVDILIADAVRDDVGAARDHVLRLAQVEEMDRHLHPVLVRLVDERTADVRLQVGRDVVDVELDEVRVKRQVAIDVLARVFLGFGARLRPARVGSGR